MEGHQFGLQAVATGKLRVVAQSVHAVVVEELRHLVGAGLGHLRERLGPSGEIEDVAVGDAGYGRHADAVLVGHVEEAARHAAQRCCPVAPVGHVGPHREDFAVEDAVGQAVFDCRIDGNPRDEFFVVGCRQVGAYLGGSVAEAGFRLHARDEEVVVTVERRAGLPIGDGLANDIARRTPDDVALLQFLCPCCCRDQGQRGQ